MARFVLFLVLTVISLTSTLAQENTQTSVAKSLQECYNNTENKVKDNRLPMTLNTLLDLIRKVENGPNLMDLRELSVSLLQRFRQDGIVRAVGLNPEAMGEALPYSPNGWQNYKFRMLLKYLVPGSAKQFPNETLTSMERCTLHSMLSSSTEEWERGDEGNVCDRLGKYVMRIARSVPDDVEVIDQNTMEENGQMKANPNSDVERIASKLNLPKSNCPVENGVINTKWGAVSAGALIAGIAAGAMPEEHIRVKDIADDVKTDLEINNLWGATISGDLAEVALYVNEDDDADGTISVGASGGWNSTEAPRWYFLQKKNQLHMTDAEIRGGLDGMILGKLFKEKLQSSIPQLKLSQLIDMYYSSRGVLSEKYRACGRRELFKEFVSLDELERQTSAFAIALDKRVRLRISLEEDRIITLSQNAAKKLEEYIPSRMNDAPCMTVASDRDDSTISSNIIILLDCSWPFATIYSALSYLLDNVDVNQYNSNYTIINAKDGSIIVNSTNAVSDLHLVFNATAYEKFAKGFDLVSTIRLTEIMSTGHMNLERDIGQAGGKSMIAILIPYTDPMDGKERTYVINRINDFINVFVPDLKFLALTKGNKEVFANIVKDTSRDVVTYTSSDATSAMPQISNLVNRIREIPRRFTNSKCGGDWVSNNQDKQLYQYVAPQGINFYKVHPNYFFGEGSRAMKIQMQGQRALTVCHSRVNIQPRANQTGSSDVTCKQISTGDYSISLTDACKDKTFIHDCASLYFSVEALQTTESTSFSCTDNGCRYPDDNKFAIIGENLVCASGANILTTNFFMLITLLSTIFVKIHA